jgi:hypothetical protein
MVASSVAIQARQMGWLRGLSFDGTYIFGILGAALVSGWFVIANPNLFPAVFVLNGWLLGYHHVISTYTRLTFDRDSFREHRFLVVWLPFIVLAGVIVAWAIFGSWVLTTLYLYWQWWHYTRQSYGVSRIYGRKASLPLNNTLTKLTVYAVPVWGILYRSYQAPDKYLFTEVKVLPVPFSLVALAGGFALIVTICWLLEQIKAFTEGRLAVAHTLYMLSHLVVFGVGYILIADINHGWLVLNIWHNSQYILTVWMFNNNRFKDQIDSRHKFLSHISQRKKVFSYFAVCLVISTLFYSALITTLDWISPAVALVTTLPLFAVVYQAINFHHYVVDAIIWKVRKKTLRQNFGIAT